MKAAVIREHGGLDCVRIEDVLEPKAGEGEVVLEVRSAALNHLDIWVCKGRPGLASRCRTCSALTPPAWLPSSDRARTA